MSLLSLPEYSSCALSGSVRWPNSLFLCLQNIASTFGVLSVATSYRLSRSLSNLLLACHDSGLAVPRYETRELARLKPASRCF